MEKINKRLLDFQKKVTVIKKDAKNPHFKNTYASLTQILSEVKPILTDCGLIVTQLINDKGIGTTIIDSDSSEFIECYIPTPTNLTPQQMGSAITYYRRYSLASILALEIDDDDAQIASTPKFESTTHDKPWLNRFQNDKVTPTENWLNVVDALINKGYTIEQVENKYRLSKENKSELIQIQNNGI
jgi:ERF superfamily